MGLTRISWGGLKATQVMAKIFCCLKKKKKKKKKNNNDDSVPNPVIPPIVKTTLFGTTEFIKPSSTTLVAALIAKQVKAIVWHLTNYWPKPKWSRQFFTQRTTL